ncbi:hypothetical protein GCM10023350_37440 [Nocardioides endophyticus]|uniref:Uncharacterized protein n=1 Tax=Nocardioides endophyticus TaxID=1353775 RepID=A0ABP8Z7P8_9ACTN
MGIVGVRRALAITVLGLMLAGLTLSGCSEAVDGARAVQTRIGRLHQVVDVDVTTPGTERTAAITVTYDDSVDQPSVLAGLVAAVVEVADGLKYPAYPLTLVPATEPASTLTIGGAFPRPAVEDAVLTTWFTLTGALLGSVGYVAGPDGERITVDSAGGAAHDLAEVQRIGHGTARTTWVFRAGTATFTMGGRVRPADLGLFQAVQRNAGVEGQPVWARGWQLDRRSGHVRLDLDLAFGDAGPTLGQLTVARYGRTLAPLAHNSLIALDRSRQRAWLTLHSGDDTFAAWASGQTPGRGRDPLGRGWDVWLVQQAAGVS